MKCQIIKTKNIETPEVNDVTTIFRYLLGILVITIHAEYRGTNVDEYKHFVSIKLFNKKILNWIYRDRYIRDFYTNKKKSLLY